MTPADRTLETPITVYGAGPAFGLPEGSPFVMKTEVQLAMAGIPFVRARGDIPGAPKHKIPYIDDGVITPDSTFIRERLERAYGADFDLGLSPRQRAEAWAIERMLEDHLYWGITYNRWLVPENFAKGPARFFFTGAPDAVRDQVLENVRAAHYGHGIGRHSLVEANALCARSLASLSMLLDGKPYLFGAQPVGVDATAFAMLASVMTPYFDTPLRRTAEALPHLSAYVDRMMLRFYPGFAWGEPERLSA